MQSELSQGADSSKLITSKFAAGVVPGGERAQTASGIFGAPHVSHGHFLKFGNEMKDQNPEERAARAATESDSSSHPTPRPVAPDPQRSLGCLSLLLISTTNHLTHTSVLPQSEPKPCQPRRARQGQVTAWRARTESMSSINSCLDGFSMHLEMRPHELGHATVTSPSLPVQS